MSAKRSAQNSEANSFAIVKLRVLKETILKFPLLIVSQSQKTNKILLHKNQQLQKNNSQRIRISKREPIKAVREKRALQRATTTYTTRQYCASTRTYYYSRTFFCPAVTTTPITVTTSVSTFSSPQYCASTRTTYYSRSFFCPPVAASVAITSIYTYSTRQYCSIYRQCYYSRTF